MEQNLSVEEWRGVAGWPYEVSNSGRVRNLSGLVLRTRPAGRGYPALVLRNKAAAWSITVHRLVAEAFIGPRPDGMEINHINGIKTDNRVENLEYVTHQENMMHRCRALGIQVGEGCNLSRLTERNVRDIRARYASGESMRKIAVAFGVWHGTVSDIVKGRSWRHI